MRDSFAQKQQNLIQKQQKQTQNNKINLKTNKNNKNQAQNQQNYSKLRDRIQKSSRSLGNIQCSSRILNLLSTYRCRILGGLEILQNVFNFFTLENLVDSNLSDCHQILRGVQVWSENAISGLPSDVTSARYW